MLINEVYSYYQKFQKGKQHCASKLSEKMKNVTVCTCEVSFWKEGPKIIRDVILYERPL